MRFYNQQHDYYCGIDLHARILYVCIIDNLGNKVVHKKINTDPDELLDVLAPYHDNIVVGVKCMHCWYWVSDLCLDYAYDFVLGHALYMKAIHGGKTKNNKIDAYKIAALLRNHTDCSCAILMREKKFEDAFLKQPSTVISISTEHYRLLYQGTSQRRALH